MSVDACSSNSRATSAAFRFSADICATVRASTSGSAARAWIAPMITPVPSGLVSSSASPHAGRGIALDPCRVRQAGHRQAVLRLHVDDRVSARDRAPGFAHLVGPALQDCGDHLGGEILGKGRDVQREQDIGAHRVDIVQRVGGRDRAEAVGVIDQRREEVQRLHDRLPLVEAIDSRIVGLVQTDEELRVLMRGKFPAKLSQNLRQGRRPILRRSTSAMRQLGQANLLDSHRSPPLHPILVGCTGARIVTWYARSMETILIRCV